MACLFVSFGLICDLQFLRDHVLPLALLPILDVAILSVLDVAILFILDVTTPSVLYFVLLLFYPFPY